MTPGSSDEMAATRGDKKHQDLFGGAFHPVQPTLAGVAGRAPEQPAWVSVPSQLTELGCSSLWLLTVIWGFS